MSNILTGFNMQGNDPIDDRIVSKSNLETLEQYLNRVPVQKRYYGLTFFALDKNNELRKYTFQTSLIEPTIDDYKELQEHVSDKAIHKTSEEIRSEIVDADIPDTIARVQWTLDQINTAVINLIGGASDEYNTLKRIQTKIEELRAKIYGDDGGTVLNTLEQALKFLNQYKDFIVDIPENFVSKQDIVDNLTTDDPTKVLSAKQGKVLSDTLTNYFESAMQSIRTETDRAINAENRIETKLDKEIDRSIKEDQRIDAKLDAEIKRSTDEDLRIDSKLDSEINRSTTEDDRLDKKIDAETTRATEAESNLNTKIETETDRAEGEESRIEVKLDNEITRSTNKDTEHDNRLTALEGDTHEQNTDLGTTNSTFQLKYNTGNKIKHESDAISVRNAADTDYVNFIAKNATFKGDLLVEGQSFVTEAETVEIKSNLLLLNKGEVGAGVTKGIAGLEIDRGTEPNYFIIFDESDNRFKAGVEGDLWNLALRESDDNMLDGYFISWNSKDKILSTTNIVNESTPLLFGRTDYKQYSGNRTDPDGNYSSYAFISEAEGNHLYNFSGSSNWNIDTDKINFRFWKPLLGTTFKRASDNSEVLYHADIVNNLTSGGTNKVLSAEQGKILQNSITSIQGSYLPLSGGTMKGSIRFPIGNGIACNDVAGTAAYVVLRTWNANNSTRMYVGTVNFPTYISSTASDLIHDRNGSSYLLWDSYNLPTPASTTDLANYLPLIGGTLTGQLIIGYAGSTPLIVNNSYTNGVDSILNFKVKGVNKTLVGYSNDNGPFIQDASNNRCIMVKSDGAYFGTGLGAGTKLALITDIPTTWDWSNITNKKIDGSDHTSSKDCNNSLTNGIYYYNQNGPTTSIGASTTDGALFHQKYSDSWIAQIAQDYRNGNLFVRGKNNGTWTAWKKVALTSDIPSISGYATQSWCNSKFAPLTNFTLTSNYATIKGNGNEICIGNTSQSSASAYMIINYRVPTGCTYAPSAFYFKAGSAESWADIYAGSIYMSSNLVATQTWSSGQFPTKTGTGASGTWGISITGNAATATNSTQLGGTAASSYVKANDNISRLTNDSGYTTQEWVNGQGFLTSDSILDKFVPTTGGYIRNSDQVLLRLQRTGVSTGTSRTIEMYFDDSNTDGTSTTPRGSIGYNSEVGMFLYSAASKKFLAMEYTGRPFYGTPRNRYYLLGSNTQYHNLDGYQRIGDIMIQWGYFTVQGNSTRAVNFPVSFTNTVWSVTGSWDKATTGSQENWGFTDYTSSGFTIINGDGSSRVFHYIAIGPFTRS